MRMSKCGFSQIVGITSQKQKKAALEEIDSRSAAFSG